MNIEEMVKHLRDGMFIYDEDTDFTEYEDPEYVSIKDDFLVNSLRIGLNRISPSSDLEEMDEEDLFPVMLLARKEVYFYLATRSAPLYDLSVAGSAGSSKITRDQRFQHYMSLIKHLETEYENYLRGSFMTGGDSDSAGGRGGLSAGNVLLSSRYYTPRNYAYAKKPSLKAKVDYVYANAVDISWRKISVDRFHSYEVYLSETPIVDEYTVELVDKSKLIKPILNKHIGKYRIEDLKPETDYFVAVIIKERNGLIGFSEVNFTTI